jgi:hypothetical protein
MNQDRMRAKRALAALRAADQRGTGQCAGGLGAEATDRLGDLDGCTMSYRTWSQLLVPGLLQTPTYAAGAIMAHTPDLDPGDLGHRVERRRKRSEDFLERRRALGDLTPSLAWFLIGETAIRRPLMNAYGHAEQLRHLLSLMDGYNNILIQVMPDDSPVPIVAEPFSLFQLDPGPTVAHLETVIGGWYSVAPDAIKRLRSAYSTMVARALSLHETREYIEEELSLCSGATAEPTSSSPHTATPTTASTSPDLPPAPSE